MAQDTSIKDWYTGRPYTVCMMHSEDKNRNGYLKSLSSNPIGWFYAILQDFIELLGTFPWYHAAESLLNIIENNSCSCIGKKQNNDSTFNGCLCGTEPE